MMTNDFAHYALIAAIAIAVSILGERRRSSRSNLERVGFMPWTFITVIATLAFAVFAGLALKS